MFNQIGNLFQLHRANFSPLSFGWKRKEKQMKGAMHCLCLINKLLFG